MSSTRAFTLAETLVVMAIVGVLTAVIYAVYPRVVAEGKRTACISNLRQMGQAIEMYAGDNGGNLPPYELCSVTCDPLTVPANISPTHAEVSIPTDPEGFKRSLALYLGSETMWWCPADPHRGQASVGENGQNDAWTSYVRGNVFQNLAVDFGQAGHAFADLTPSQRFRPVVLADRCFQTSQEDGPAACQTAHGHRQNSLLIDGSVANYPWVWN